MRVSILGACGRIGLPLSYIAAKAGHQTTGIDPLYNVGKMAQYVTSTFPYVERGMSYSEKHIWGPDFEKIEFTNQYMSLNTAEVIIVIIGTPVDAENNPRVENIIKLFDDDIIPRTKKGQLIILRSTVSPGITDLIIDRIEDKTNWKVGEDFYLVFAPERVSQGHSLEEISIFPQLIGSHDEASANAATQFFTTLGVNEFEYLTPKEAEYGKLITNMYRYVNIAFANEMYMLASRENVDIHKVITAANKNYPRMNMMYPGPNAAGPCLFKDGKLLTENVPYVDLISAAFNINEGMPQHVFNLVDQHKTEKLKSIAIFGMTFKKDNDDIRFSESYKLKKILIKKGIKAVEVDGHLPNKSWLDQIEDLSKVQAIIIMTPHTDLIEDFEKIIETCKMHNVMIVDAWKCLPKNLPNIDYAYFDNDNGVYAAFCQNVNKTEQYIQEYNIKGDNNG
jgi:nucleotide sugar dehydrogenase